MRPLPRVHAITDARVLALEDLGVRAAAIASSGPSVALHVRDHAAGGARLAGIGRRFLSLARPPEAAVIVNGHPDIARALGAQGVQLTPGDLTPADARTVFPAGWVGCSVHSAQQAEIAAGEGADFLIVGTVFPSRTHPESGAGGLDLVTRCATFGLPVIAIGGVSPSNAASVRDAGAYGAAAISALWHADDPAGATVEMLRPWGAAS
ncbi:MAG: thiamine phosphate synthase [Gemmatimonadota bacterium]